MKLKGPMMSLDASGSIGGVLVASKWKGRNYMRTLVTPSNPQSAGQTTNRAMMRFLTQEWAGIDPLDQAQWEPLAAQTAISPFNAYVSYNMNRWTQWNAPTQILPPDQGGIATVVSAFTGTAGVRQATLAVTAGTMNQGWGAILYRNDTTGFTPAKTDVVRVAHFDGTENIEIVDTPVTPGAWFYRLGAFSRDGNKGTIFATEVSVTVLS